jgi:serine/threonine protein kinase
MSLAPGTRLGPYEIGAPLGAGGMGVVYRARDTRLDREVAVKVLPADVSADPARRARFQREARAIAALAHPHLCAIHDVGSDANVDYLVLELIDGESLAARLRRGRLPLAEALTLAAEIARAVGYAHRQGVVHRDLKPANIMLTRAGVKVLDFGLARMVGRDAEPAAQVTASLQTEPGAVMGTLPYMAPEQIEGLAVDARADVFAFGATFYEMLTAKRAFDAPSGPALMALILRDQPPSVLTVDAAVPPAIDRIIRTCLEKRPDDRFSSMSDVARALEWAAPETSTTPALAQPLPSAVISRRSLLAGGIAVASAAAGVAIGRLWRPVSPLSPAYVVDLPLPSGYVHGPGIAVSPNGRWLAVSLNPSQVLWIYDLVDGRWFRPPGVKTNAFYPFWSVDGSEIAYVSGSENGGGKAWRVKVPDGVPSPICDFNHTGGRCGTWCEDGSIVLAGATTGLYKVPAYGGEPTEFLPRANGESSLRFPVAAGPFVIYQVQRPGVPSELRQARLDGSGAVRVPLETPLSAAIDRGRLFYNRQGVVVGQAYDVPRAQLVGEPVRVAVDALAGPRNIGQLQVGAGAGHVAVMNTVRGVSHLSWKTRAGAIVANVGDLADWSEPVLSPDDRRLVVASTVPEHSGRQLFVVDLASGATRRLAPSVFDDHNPVWSPDGTRVVFRSLRGINGNGNLYAVDADGPAAVTTTLEVFASMFPVGWAPDGSFVWLTYSAPEGFAKGIWIVPPGATGPGRLYLRGDGIFDARLSPEGTRIAYVWQASGRSEVYVDTFPAPGPKPIQVSRAGANHVRWSGDGRQLFYVEQNRLMSAAVSTAPGLTVGAPQALFPMVVTPGAPTGFAPSFDGSRVLVVEPRTAESYSVKLTLNWAPAL